MAWDACTTESHIFLHWIECHPGSMSMAQGVVTAIGIFAAILAPQIIKAREKRAARYLMKIRFIETAEQISDSAQRLNSAFINRSTEALSTEDVNRLSSLRECVSVFGSFEPEKTLRPREEIEIRLVKREVERALKDIESGLSSAWCGNEVAAAEIVQAAHTLFRCKITAAIALFGVSSTNRLMFRFSEFIENRLHPN